jgi:hypothetical protein
VPDHIKALSAAYSWYTANKLYFENEDPDRLLNHERYGWIREDKESGACICFIPDKLKKYLNSEIGPNTYEAATDEWKNLKILIPKLQKKGTGSIVRLKNNQISFDGRKVMVVKIPFEKFKEYLKLEDENEEQSNPCENPGDGFDSQVPSTLQAHIALKKVSMHVQVISYIHIVEQNLEITGTTDDIIVISDDAELAEIMIQEGFS